LIYGKRTGRGSSSWRWQGYCVNTFTCCLFRGNVNLLCWCPSLSGINKSLTPLCFRGSHRDDFTVAVGFTVLNRRS